MLVMKHLTPKHPGSVQASPDAVAAKDFAKMMVMTPKHPGPMQGSLRPELSVPSSSRTQPPGGPYTADQLAGGGSKSATASVSADSEGAGAAPDGKGLAVAPMEQTPAASHPKVIPARTDLPSGPPKGLRPPPLLRGQISPLSPPPSLSARAKDQVLPVPAPQAPGLPASVRIKLTPKPKPPGVPAKASRKPADLGEPQALAGRGCKRGQDSLEKSKSLGDDELDELAAALHSKEVLVQELTVQKSECSAMRQQMQAKESSAQEIRQHRDEMRQEEQQLQQRARQDMKVLEEQYEHQERVAVQVQHKKMETAVETMKTVARYAMSLEARAQQVEENARDQEARREMQQECYSEDRLQLRLERNLYSKLNSRLEERSSEEAVQVLAQEQELRREFEERETQLLEEHRVDSEEATALRDELAESQSQLEESQSQMEALKEHFAHDYKRLYLELHEQASVENHEELKQGLGKSPVDHPEPHVDIAEASALRGEPAEYRQEAQDSGRVLREELSEYRHMLERRDRELQAARAEKDGTVTALDLIMDLPESVQECREEAESQAALRTEVQQARAQKQILMKKVLSLRLMRRREEKLRAQQKERIKRYHDKLQLAEGRMHERSQASREISELEAHLCQERRRHEELEQRERNRIRDHRRELEALKERSKKFEEHLASAHLKLYEELQQSEEEEFDAMKASLARKTEESAALSKELESVRQSEAATIERETQGIAEALAQHFAKKIKNLDVKLRSER